MNNQYSIKFGDKKVVYIYYITSYNRPI